MIGLILLAGFLLRSWKSEQPILENAIGRQIPTAMVARNLDRGSGFLHPQLDTGPFPNYFVVEPPLYQGVAVALHRLTGLPLDPVGRLVSSAAIAMGSIGLFLLTRWREGPSTAFFAVLAFNAFPVVVRYGRAFQPDAFMVGSILLGMGLADSSRLLTPAWKAWIARLLGVLSLSIGLAAKILAIGILVPAAISLRTQLRPIPRFLILGAATIPAFLWYLHAFTMLDDGSQASIHNLDIWKGVLQGSLSNSGPIAPGFALWGIRLVRAFTPIACLLALWGAVRRRGTVDWLWFAWGLVLLISFLVLARKLHHDYYWLMAAPLFAVLTARGAASLLDHRAWGAFVCLPLVVLLVLMSALQSRSTWRTPDEWEHASEAARRIQSIVPGDSLLVAPEALLYLTDRKGCRLEWSPEAQIRAAREWNQSETGDSSHFHDPTWLIEFYRHQGAGWLAELPERLRRVPGARQQLISRYSVVVDSPQVMILRLDSQPGEPGHDLE